MNVLEPEHFLRDLDHVHTTLGFQPASSAHFLSDLEWVHGQPVYKQIIVPAESATALYSLAALFKNSREKTLKRLGGPKWWETLPPTDPLRCPVSLFGTLDLGSSRNCAYPCIGVVTGSKRESRFWQYPTPGFSRKTVHDYQNSGAFRYSS